ncbi:MAG: TadE/TadG family type IV pilus assembly protein [Aliidongia sp.]
MNPLTNFNRRGGRFLHRCKVFLARTDGIAALEFALLAPVMIYTLLVAADVAHGLTISRRLTNAADVIAQLVSQQTTNGQVQGTITDVDLLGDFASIITTFPDVLTDAGLQFESWQTDIQPIVTSVAFGPTTSPPSPNCTVTSPQDPPISPTCTVATAIWSAGFISTKFATTRACGLSQLLPAVSNFATPSLSTIPPGLYIPGTVIVVDITYVFRPTFTEWLTGPFTFQRTAYIAPRFFTELSYSGPSGKNVTSSTNTSTHVTTYADNPSGITSCSYTGTRP